MAIKYIVIHHTAVDVDNTPEEIANYHVNVKGWPGIGYHFVVRRDGSVFYVGDITTKRANVYGRNHEVVGICLTGNFNDLPPGQAQLTGAKMAVAFVQALLGEKRPVLSHREIALPESSTVCPGATFEQWKGAIS